MKVENKRKKNNKTKLFSLKKMKKKIISNLLIFKQTLITTWKNKLQLVILLLITIFTTSFITGSWISYSRIIKESNELGLNNIKFDSILEYSQLIQNNIKQIANQAFSLKLGKFYVQDDNFKKNKKALYFDDTRIGKEILPINKDNLTIKYIRNAENKITGINNISWNSQKEKPLFFDLNNNNVKASIYGQLLLKSKKILNYNLKKKLINAANDLYNDVFLKMTAPNILKSIDIFIKEWIEKNQSNEILTKNDNQVTDWILKNKINFQSYYNNYDIPDNINLKDEKQRQKLFMKLVKKTDPDPRINNNYGMNGQWMRIYRNFSASEKDSNIFTNFNNNEIGYYSPFNYNVINDEYETDKKISIYLIRAVAALQMHDLYIRNQFTASAGIINNTQINVKIVNIGLYNLNHTNLKIFEGILPTSKNEIVITPQYARKNKSNKSYKPGDNININGINFIISGIGGDAYDIYPTINDLDSIPNTRTEFIAYVTPSAWNNLEWYKNEDKTDNTLIYFTKWNNIGNVNINDFNIDLFDDFFQKNIFSENGINDLNQNNYNEYLINKYVHNNLKKYSPYKYIIQKNNIITKNNKNFLIYNNKKIFFNLIINNFFYIIISGILFLLTVIIFITTLIIKTIIQKEKYSMGILKSIGYKTKQIVNSYLAYPLLILLIAIPIGWIIGLVIQIYLTEILNTLFVLPYNVFNFDIIPLFISIFLIVGFIIIVTLLTSFYILKKNPLFLIKQDSDLKSNFYKNKKNIFFKKRFYIHFLLSLSKNSWKKILVISIIFFLTTFSIITTILIPTTINSLKINYFKTQKYKNYYEYQTPMPNMPMSKYGLYSWNFFNKPKNEKYYPTYGAMPWPENKIIYDDINNSRIGWYNPLSFKKENSTKNNFDKIFIFDSNFSYSKRKEFLEKMSFYYQNQSTGTLDLDDLVWAYSWLGGKAFSNKLINDLIKEDNTFSKIFSYNIVNFASGQLPNILQVMNPGIPPSQEAIKEILKQVLPGFIRQGIDSLPIINKNEDPYDYFSIGHNTISFNPKSINNGDIDGPDEELVTQFKIYANENKELMKNGLMDIIGINPNTVMLLFENYEINKIKYNNNDNNIPIIINKAFQSKFKLHINEEFSAVPQVNTLYYKNNKNEKIPLPKENWYYGKTPPINDYELKNNNIWSKNNTKWNYRGKRKIKLNNNINEKYSDEHGFRYNGIYDNKGKIILDDEPSNWNNINFIWLKLPDDIHPNAKIGKIPKADNSKIMDFNLSNIIDKTGKWIKPFSYDFIKTFNNFDSNDPLSILLNCPAEWFMGMVNNNILTKENNINNNNLQEDAKNNMKIWWQNITGEINPIHKYKIIGIQNSYDAPKAYIDQKWANKIMGYNYINNNPYFPKTKIFQWFNGKLSANYNIFDLIGRMSFKSNLDDYTIYSINNLNGNKNIQIVKNNYLLSKKQAMINKMSDITFGASSLFILTTIICSLLIVIIITNLFVNEFKYFMANMKVEGYTNWEINYFILGIFTPWIFLSYILGFTSGLMAMYSLISIFTKFLGIALPFIITWWILPISFIIINIIYILTFVINNNELNKINLIKLLKYN